MVGAAEEIFQSETWCQNAFPKWVIEEMRQEKQKGLISYGYASATITG
jgi:hypothetical protein